MQSIETSAKIVYTVQDLVGILRISRQTLYRILNAGDLRSRKVGGRRLVTHQALMSYLGEA